MKRGLGASLTAVCLALSACAQVNTKPADAQFVGREACAPCHATELTDYTGSAHDLAMDSATAGTVLGNFKDAEFIHQGVTTRFFRRGDQFYVRTQGEGGLDGEFQVLYTFGVFPLQQYLVGFPGGRLQALPFCWDTRPAAAGGQRWFHLYGAQHIAPSDELFWTRVSQNWNYACAECHSTNLKKNYNAASRTYTTTWSEIDVSCEACHGPGSNHIEWAHRASTGDTLPWPHKGLQVEFERRSDVHWILAAGDSIARRSTKPAGALQVEACGQCHSRRSTESDYFFGAPLSATHRPALLSESLYFVDGQIREEVYEYGSFLQSKMHHAGVQCSDCHNVHSGRLYAEGDALCQRCHQAETFTVRKHHFHDPDSAGARCVNCHMPQRTYMGVDMRADHSLRIPRPDLTVKLGVPNACNGCHKDRSAEWAAQAARNWYGEPKAHPYASTFAAAAAGDPRSKAPLEQLVMDSGQAAIVKASALSFLGRLGGARTMVIDAATANQDPIVRAAAVEAAAPLPGNLGIPRIEALLTDSVGLVKARAARALAGRFHPPAGSAEALRFDSTLTLYENSQMAEADHPSSWLNIGNLHLSQEEFPQALQAFETAVAVDSLYYPAYVNLAEALRSSGQEARSREVLQQVLARSPEDAGTHHALGLWWIRAGRADSAEPHLARAWRSQPQQARYAWVYAVALQSRGQAGEALNVVQSALSAHPYSRELLELCVSLCAELGRREEALQKLKALREYYGDMPEYGALESSLKTP